MKRNIAVYALGIITGIAATVSLPVADAHDPSECPECPECPKPAPCDLYQALEAPSEDGGADAIQRAIEAIKAAEELEPAPEG